jgi:uncharacterized protein YeaO (DUF488 family)
MARKKLNIRVKRVYDPPEPDDGYRVLVDRLWPRGMTRESAHIDLWLKEVAPSAVLRTWFRHAPERWEEFRRRYKGELEEKDYLLNHIREKASNERVTLLFAAKSEDENNAVCLRDYLFESAGRRPLTTSRSHI